MRIAAVDLVDDDQAAQLALARELHQTLREGVQAGGRAHDDGDRLDGLEHRKRLAEKVRITRGVDEVDVSAVVVEAADRAVERVLQAPFLRVEIRDSSAAREAAAAAGGPCLRQQRLHERGLARAGRSDQRDVTDARSHVPHGDCPPVKTGGARPSPASDRLLRQACRRLPEGVPWPQVPRGRQHAGVRHE